jgi:hypothetical protein
MVAACVPVEGQPKVLALPFLLELSLSLFLCSLDAWLWSDYRVLLQTVERILSLLSCSPRSLFLCNALFFFLAALELSNFLTS